MRLCLTLAIIATSGMLGGQLALAQTTNELAALSRDFGSGLTGAKLGKAIEKANAFPLGSERNPVRANMPEGEAAYLQRLRCSDGNAPQSKRLGSFGTGPFGYILDGYELRCAGSAPVTVRLDMYHEHIEEAAIPGFTIVPSNG